MFLSKIELITLGIAILCNIALMYYFKAEMEMVNERITGAFKLIQTLTHEVSLLNNNNSNLGTTVGNGNYVEIVPNNYNAEHSENNTLENVENHENYNLVQVSDSEDDSDADSDADSAADVDDIKPVALDLLTNSHIDSHNVGLKLSDENDSDENDSDDNDSDDNDSDENDSDDNDSDDNDSDEADEDDDRTLTQVDNNVWQELEINPNMANSNSNNNTVDAGDIKSINITEEMGQTTDLSNLEELITSVPNVVTSGNSSESALLNNDETDNVTVKSSVETEILSKDLESMRVVDLRKMLRTKNGISKRAADALKKDEVINLLKE